MNFICVIELNIRNPQITSAGAVANDGMAMNIGANSMEIRNMTAVTTAERPVLPPAATPAEDSTKVVVVEVPRTAPAVVATESARREVNYAYSVKIHIKTFTKGFSEL